MNIEKETTTGELNNGQFAQPQTSAEDMNNSNSNYDGIEIILIENTPFSVIKGENEMFGAIGQHRITENYIDIENLKKDLTTISWDRISQLVYVMTKRLTEEKI